MFDKITFIMISRSGCIVFAVPVLPCYYTSVGSNPKILNFELFWQKSIFWTSTKVLKTEQFDHSLDEKKAKCSYSNENILKIWTLNHSEHHTFYQTWTSGNLKFSTGMEGADSSQMLAQVRNESSCWIEPMTQPTPKSKFEPSKNRGVGKVCFDRCFLLSTMFFVYNNWN